MKSQLHLLLIAFAIVSGGFALPYRAFSSRAVPGRLRTSSEPDPVKDYLSYYLDMAKQRGQSSYGLPEYEPAYQQGYLSTRPQINPVS